MENKFLENSNFVFPGEALGAIGDPEALAILEQYSKDPVVEVKIP